MLEFWEAGLQFLVYLAICELHLSPPALSEMGSRMIWKTKRYALCTMHYETLVRSRMIWKTAAISPRFQHPLNSATPLCERETDPLSPLPTPTKRVSAQSQFFGAIKKIFSPTPSFSSSHTYKAHFWTDLIFWSTSYPQKITSHTYQGAEFLKILLFGAPQYVDIF